jgi:cytochrome b involved in lipid metabolism
MISKNHMKNTFIVAMFIFWGFVVAVISAGYVVKQNRLAQESMQKTYLESLQQITSTLTQSKNTAAVISPSVITQKPTTVKPVVTNPVSKPAVVTAPVTASTPKPAGLTLSTVATHNTQSDCWVVINGNVYSVASYIPMHPGGAQRIINVCGGDATSLFTGTGGRGSHRHSSYAQSLLGSYLVGALQ